MEFKALEFKEIHHVKYKEIKEKYKNDFNTNLVKLSSDELKSILALLFSMKYHLLKNPEQKNELNKNIVFEIYPIINISTKFGRQMIENLDNEYVTWFNKLQDKSYLLYGIFKDSELNDFVHLALIDYMAIRKFEFGKFFLKEWAKIIIDSKGIMYNSNIEKIKLGLEKNTGSKKIIAEKIENANPKLTIYEGLLLVFTLKEILLKSNNANMDYAISNYIVRDNIHELNMKRTIYMSTIKDTINQRWNFNKGRGGLRR